MKVPALVFCNFSPVGDHLPVTSTGPKHQRLLRPAGTNQSKVELHILARRSPCRPSGSSRSAIEVFFIHSTSAGNRGVPDCSWFGPESPLPDGIGPALGLGDKKLPPEPKEVRFSSRATVRIDSVDMLC